MKSRLYYAVVCYILAVVLLFVCVPIVKRMTYPKTEAVRVVKAIEQGEQITVEKLESIEIGAWNLSDGVIEKSEDAIGRYAAVDIVADDILMDSKISQLPLDGDVPKDILPSDQVVTLLQVKMIEGSEYPLPQMGDVMKLNLFRKKLTDIPELQFIRVLSVLPQSEEDTAVTLTVAVNEKQRKFISRHSEDLFYGSVIVRSNEELAMKLLAEQKAHFEEAD